MTAARRRRASAAQTSELALSEASVEQIITLSNLDESLGTLLRRTR